MKQDKEWNYMYNLLVEYKEKYGNTEITYDYLTNKGESLGAWVSDQRSKYKNNSLSEDMIEKLKLIDFRFHNLDTEKKWDRAWERMYNLLIEYKEKYGNTEVSQKYMTKCGRNLGAWVNNQRTLYKSGKLSKERENKLRLLSFRFEHVNREEKSECAWNHMYNLLIEYKEKYGNTEVFLNYVTEAGKNLGQWVNTQRSQYKNNVLSEDRIEKLKLIGFRFDHIEFKKNREYRWNYMYNLLTEYKKKYGNTEIPYDYLTNKGESLGAWVSDQRILYRNNKLSKEQKEKLKLLGFRFGIIHNTLSDSEKIRKECLYYNVDYEQYKDVFDELSYDDFVSRVNYISRKGLNILDENGNLNSIFIKKNNILTTDEVYKISNNVKVRRR